MPDTKADRSVKVVLFNVKGHEEKYPLFTFVTVKQGHNTIAVVIALSDLLLSTYMTDMYLRLLTVQGAKA